MALLKTNIGSFIYNEKEKSNEFLGIRYANANRFEYATLVNNYDENYDATKAKDSFMQKRKYYEHLEIPERLFYHKEFRNGINFNYDENAFYLNIWTPKDEGTYPVMIYIYGGGFDSGSIYESPFDGSKLASMGIVVVTISYRVGIFGYLTSEEVYKEFGHDGNFGLDDQLKAITWVKNNIGEFYGDTNNITVCGQSAGAISIQYLCLSNKAKGLFNKAIMLSGAGLFPKFSLPRYYENNREYWIEVMKLCNCKDFNELKTVDTKVIFDALEIQKSRRKDNTYHMMPVIDNYILTDSIDKLIKNPFDIEYMIGFTNRDMFAVLMEMISMKYRKQVNGYAYYFDNNAKGDNNLAFHSSDLRFVFGTLDKSWRPYTDKDYELSNKMMTYITQFVKTGNPNIEGLPLWKKCNKAIRFSSGKKIKMVRPSKLKLLRNTLKGDPR